MKRIYHSLFIFFLLIFSVMALPAVAKSDSTSKSIPHMIQSASELDYPPFSIVRSDGTADGFSVELLKAVVHAIGHDISFEVAPWNEIKQKLIEGHFDVLPLVSYSDERDKVLDFTAPYLKMHGTIFIRKDEQSIHNENDLKDKEVLVMRGDTAHEYAIRKNLSDKLILTDTFEQAMELLSDGRHDAIIIQQLVGFQLIKKLKISNIVDIGSFEESSLKPVSNPLSGFEQKFCIAVQEGDKELLSLLNEGLTLVISNGTYEALYNKWFAPILPQPSISLARIAKYLLIILLPILFFIGIIGIWYLKIQVAGKTKYLRKEIKERERIEDALQKSEKNLSITLDSIGDAVIATDIAGKVTRMNPVAQYLTGWTLEEALGLNLNDVFNIVNSQTKIPAVNPVKQVLETGKIVGLANHTLLISKNGSTYQIADSAAPIQDDAGNILGIVMVFRDVTEEYRIQKTVLESEERFFTVLNSIDATIYVADMETYEILFMNKNMIEHFGRDMTGEICWKAFRGESNPCSFCTNDQLIDKNGVPTDVCTWQDKNPISGKWYNNYDRAVEWTDGRLVRLQIATDITDLKKMETQLQQAQKMESIGTLAGGIAHDFNNILFPIVGHTEMLLEDVPEDSPFRESLNGIYTSALRARDLVKQILTFSRQEGGELKLMKLQPIIKEVLKLIRSSIPATIEIKQNINPNCGIVKADPTQIHQIVMNLSTNAYHAMEDTGGQLAVSLKEIELEGLDLINPDMIPGVYAYLTVADTGKGMNKELTEKIFDPFFTTKAIDKGTGMGLSVVHGIVKSMQGAIRVDSKVDKGTKFHVYLPVVERPSEKHEVLQIKKAVQGGIERILLVDDEEAILIMGKRMLERLGYQVTSYTSSLEALEAFKDHPDKFDMIITDMAMPNMSGDKLSAELVKTRSDIPILLCTGFSEIMSDEKAASLGIKGFLLKPIVMTDLAQKIREVLDEN